jgi:signal transduction histidine kinase
MREGKGRTGSVPLPLLARRDEVGELANAVSDSASALWARMDATEQFAADVAHELKNPLSSIRSAIETLMRIEDPARRKQLADDHRPGRDAVGPVDQRRQRRVPGRRRNVAGHRAAGRCRADRAHAQGARRRHP